MELMKVTLHSNMIERVEKIYPELVKKGQFDSSAETKQDYFKFLTIVQDLKIIDLVVNNQTLELTYLYDGDGVVQGIPMSIRYIYPVPEELIKEIIHDPRIGLGYCIQCHSEFPIDTGCTQNKHIYGKCDPKNFIPFLDKEGKKVFKGARHYKKLREWNNPDEFIPYSPEIMDKNREFAREVNTERELQAKKYEEISLLDEAKDVRLMKYKEF